MREFNDYRKAVKFTRRANRLGYIAFISNNSAFQKILFC